MAARKEGACAGGPGPAGGKDAGRDRRPAALVDLDPWGALLAAMWDEPAAGGDAAGGEPDREPGTRSAGTGRTRAGKAARAARGP